MLQSLRAVVRQFAVWLRRLPCIQTELIQQTSAPQQRRTARKVPSVTSQKGQGHHAFIKILLDSDFYESFELCLLRSIIHHESLLKIGPQVEDKYTKQN